jgi:hypothetical protein
MPFINPEFKYGPCPNPTIEYFNKFMISEEESKLLMAQAQRIITSDSDPNEVYKIEVIHTVCLEDEEGDFTGDIINNLNPPHLSHIPE